MVNTQKHKHATVPGPGRKKNEVDQLMIEVGRAVHQTGRISQATTRVAAEITCLADVVDAVVAEYEQERLLGIVPAPRCAPDGPSSH